MEKIEKQIIIPTTSERESIVNSCCNSGCVDTLPGKEVTVTSYLSTLLGNPGQGQMRGMTVIITYADQADKLSNYCLHL